jgi:hypothetical protein
MQKPPDIKQGKEEKWGCGKALQYLQLCVAVSRVKSGVLRP